MFEIKTDVGKEVRELVEDFKSKLLVPTIWFQTFHSNHLTPSFWLQTFDFKLLDPKLFNCRSAAMSANRSELLRRPFSLIWRQLETSSSEFLHFELWIGDESRKYRNLSKSSSRSHFQVVSRESHGLCIDESVTCKVSNFCKLWQKLSAIATIANSLGTCLLGAGRPDARSLDAHPLGTRPMLVCSVLVRLKLVLTQPTLIEPTSECSRTGEFINKTEKVLAIKWNPNGNKTKSNEINLKLNQMELIRMESKLKSNGIQIDSKRNPNWNQIKPNGFANQTTPVIALLCQNSS